MARQFDEVVFNVKVSIGWSDLSSAWRASSVVGGEPIYGNVSASPVGAMVNLFAQLAHSSEDLLAGMDEQIRKADPSRKVIELDALPAGAPVAATPPPAAADAAKPPA